MDELTIGRKLALLEEVTETGSSFWTKELALGDQTWRQWRNGRSAAAALKKENAIRGALDGLGFDVPEDFLRGAIRDEDDFRRLLRARIKDATADYIEFEVSSYPMSDVTRHREDLRKLRPFGRADRSNTAAMIICPNTSIVRSLLNSWLGDPTTKPMIPVLHFDVRRYSDSSILVMRILAHLDPTTAKLSLSPDEQIARLSDIATRTRFLLILENIDWYADHDLLPVGFGSDFRIGLPHRSIGQIIFGCFLFSDPSFAARLILTGRSPLHTWSLQNRYPLLRVSGSLLSANEELLFSVDVGDLRGSRAAITALAGMFPNRNELSPPLSRLITETSDSAFEPLAEDTVKAKTVIASLSLDCKSLLRLVASSLDGLRTDTMTNLLNRLGGIAKDSLGSPDRMLQARADCGLLLISSDDTLRSNTATAVRIYNNTRRLCVLSEWEDSDLKTARIVYREIGFLAHEAANAESHVVSSIDARTSPTSAASLAVSERLVQAAQCLLASIEPDDRRAPIVAAKYDSLRKAASVEEVVRRLERRDRLTAGDIVQFVFHEIWQRRLEDESRFRMIRTHGLIETKISLLLSFFNPGTLLPRPAGTILAERRETTVHLANSQEVQIRIGIAIAASRAGRNATAIAVARSAEPLLDTASSQWKRDVYKLLSDSLIRAGELGKSLSVLDRAISALAYAATGDVDDFLPWISKVPKEKRRFVHVCAIDLFCRKGEILVIQGRMAEAARCFSFVKECSNQVELIRDEDRRRSQSDIDQKDVIAFRGANGRRFINYLFREACRHRTSRLIALSEAQRHLDSCLLVARTNNWDNDLANLAIDQAKIDRLSSSVQSLRRNELLERIGKAESLSRNFTVSTVTGMEADAERTRILSFCAFATGNADDMAEGLRCALRLLQMSRTYSLPVLEAEAYLLLCELEAPGYNENLAAHDELCDRHGIGCFQHPRALIVHGKAASTMGAW